MLYYNKTLSQKPLTRRGSKPKNDGINIVEKIKNRIDPINM